MSQIPIDPMQPVVSGSVDADIPCRKCSYNLRGLPIDGRCPECGTPVGVSVNGELLRYSDPTFVYTLRRGISLLLWGILIVIIMIVASIVLMMARVIVTNSPVFQLIMFIAGIPTLMGAWLVTTPDPSGIGEDQYGSLRKAVRICLAIGLLSNLINFIAGSAGPLPPSMRQAFQIFVLLMYIIQLVGWYSELAYLKKLAMRIPNAPLSRQANSVMWGFGVSYGLMIATFLLMVFLGPAVRGGLKAFGCFILILFLVMLIYLIMYLIMLFSFGGQFDEQTRLAQAAWAKSHEGTGPQQA